jgi:hypothetical protein
MGSGKHGMEYLFGFTFCLQRLGWLALETL